MNDVRGVRILRAVLIGMFVIVWQPSLFAQSRDATIPSLPDNTNPSTSIRIVLRTAQQPLTAGAEITLAATADRDCHLTILHLGSSGKVTVLWPNAGSRWDDRVASGKAIEVPGPRVDFQIVVDGKTPMERMVAYATTEKDSVLRQADFRVVPDGKLKVFVGDVPEFIRTFRSRVTLLPPEHRWGTAEATVRVRATTYAAAREDDPCQQDLELKEVTSKPAGRKAFATRDLGEKSLAEMEQVLRSEPDQGRLGAGRVESVSGFRQREARNMTLKGEYADLETLNIKEPDIPKSVCGTDERVRQSPCTDVPWRWNCALVITWPNRDRSIGTGWLIGPRTVMTAGHCVYNHKQKAWATMIEVSPGTDGTSRPYGSQQSSDLRSVDKWVNEADGNFDFGAIILPNDKLGKELGHFGFQALSGKSLKAAELNTAGYPGDKPRGTLWFMAGPVSAVDCGEISYMIDTFGGQSGSPVWTKIDDKRVAVGIHVRGGCPNKATRIRKPVFDMMMHWKEQ